MADRHCMQMLFQALDRVRSIVTKGALLALLVCFLSSAHAAVGRTSGSFAVTPAASASYTIPIFTPPGPRGVQPQIALVYNSNAGFGYMGKGWSLNGLSSVSRCKKTLAQDAYRGPYSFDNAQNAAYCLDGNRLRLQSGTYGQGGSVWATELADFSRISAVGTNWWRRQVGL
jgi:hypothetical protein